MGRGTSKAGKATNRHVGDSLRTNIDAVGLSKKQIDAINLQRADVFQGALAYVRETQLASMPQMTATQRHAFEKVWEDGDTTALQKASIKTKQAVYAAAQAKYDAAQKRLSMGDYDVRDDFHTNPSGRRVSSGTFTHAYSERQKASRILNELHSQVHKEEREITSSTYKRAMRRSTAAVEGFLTGVRKK